ncbi:ANTAR domain-containing protein [Streptomyces sp. NPDC057302]|uniref:ANTAR domain-containing protein n=1 Tax=Streptomyces sp. NPDC057302 TaxID=3346094 RepID=UPI00363102AA
MIKGERSQLVAEVCADLSTVSLVEESEGILKLAEACLILLPVSRVRVTLHGPAGAGQMAFVDATGEGACVDDTLSSSEVALELRHQGAVLGVVRLLPLQERPLIARDLSLGRALVDLAAVGFANRHFLEDVHDQVRGLQHELGQKIVVEQAKGMLSQFTGGTPEQALEMMYAQSISSRQSLPVLAREIIDGSRASSAQAVRVWPSWVLRQQEKGSDG